MLQLFSTENQTGHPGFLFAHLPNVLSALQPVTLKIYVKPGIEMLRFVCVCVCVGGGGYSGHVQRGVFVGM